MTARAGSTSCAGSTCSEPACGPPSARGATAIPIATTSTGASTSTTSRPLACWTNDRRSTPSSTTSTSTGSISRRGPMSASSTVRSSAFGRPPARSTSTRSTSRSCWPPSGRTWTPASSRRTATCTTTSPVDAPASGWRSSCAGVIPLTRRAADASVQLAPLVAGRLIEVEDLDRPFLTRALRVPDAVTAFLLGADDTDPIISHLLTAAVPTDSFDTVALARALRLGQRLLYVRDRVGAAALSFAVSGCRVADLPAVVARSRTDLRRRRRGDRRSRRRAARPA